MFHDVILKTRLRVLEAAALRASPRTETWASGLDLELIIPAALLAPAETSPEHFELLAASAQWCTSPPDEFVLTALVRVHNEEALRRIARECYASNWSDVDWSPESLGEAAYEIFLASNANPAPCDLGFEFLDTRYESDVRYVAPVERTR